MVTDRKKCNVVDIGIILAKTLNHWYPEQFEIRHMSRLLFDEATMEAIKADKPLAEIKKLWVKKQDEFKARRKKYLIYH